MLATQTEATLEDETYKIPKIWLKYYDYWVFKSMANGNR